MVALDILVVGQNLPGREAYCDSVQGMWCSGEEHRRQPDAFAPEPVPQLQIRISGPKFYADANLRNRGASDGNDIVVADGKQRPDLLDHLENEIIRASPEADDDCFGVLP